MLDLKLQDKIPCSEIKKGQRIIDIVEIHTETTVEMGQSYSKG